MMSKSTKRSHSREEPLSRNQSECNNNNNVQSQNDMPQSSKGLALVEAEAFVVKSMKLFNQLGELNDLKSLYELGKQLSRLYFDCAEYRLQISMKLIRCEFPEYVVKVMKKLNNLGIFKHDDIWFSSFYFYNICWNFSECCFEFASSLATCGLPSLLVMNILHKPYLDNLSSRNIYFLIKASLSIMHNLCRYPGNRYHFKSDKVKETLIDFTSREEELIRVISILCLAFLLEDEEAMLLTKQSNNFLYNFIDIITKAKLHDRGRFMGFATWELLQALCVFTSNDSVKRDIVEYRGVTMVFDILSKASNHEEIKECISILWNLAFDPEVKAVLLKQYNCLQVVDCYVNHEDEEIRNNAAGLKWILEDYMKNNRLLAELSSSNSGPATMVPPSIASGTASSGNIAISSHLFFCFAEDNRDIVYRIADKLKRSNISLIIPKNSAMDPALKNQENRFRGIVQSNLFVFVLSEASKSSQQCRAEAQYAGFLKKPIIPVIVQSKFKPAGWMDKFIDKVFFDFAGKTRDFDANVELLKTTLLSECGGGPGGGGGWGNFHLGHTGCPPQEDEVKSVRSVKSCSSRPDNRMLAYAESMDNPRAAPPQAGHHQFNHSASLDSAPHEDPANYLDMSNAPPSGAIGYLHSSSNNMPTGANLLTMTGNIESVKKWSKQDVAQWLVNNDLSHLRLKLSQFNGSMLASLLHIKQEAPEYFYKCLEHKIQLNFMDTLSLVDALYKLLHDVV